jgi:hypothetical protein
MMLRPRVLFLALAVLAALSLCVLSVEGAKTIHCKGPNGKPVTAVVANDHWTAKDLEARWAKVRGTQCARFAMVPARSTFRPWRAMANGCSFCFLH